MPGGGRAPEPSLATLELIYAQLSRERDRLRDAQRAVTSQLGPIPASTSVILGLLAAVATHGERTDSQRVLVVVVALAFSVLITALSAQGSGGTPYRKMREELYGERLDPTRLEEALPPSEWLMLNIGVERDLIAALGKSFDRQRGRLFLVQGLLVAEAAV